MFSRLKKAYQNVSPYVFTRKNAPIISGSLLLTGAGILTSLGTSYTFSQAVNSLYSGETTALLGMELTPYAMIVVSGAVYTANNILSSLNEWLLTPLGPRVSKALVINHVNELMQKDWDFHLATPFGTHVTRLNKCFTIGNAISSQLLSKILPPVLNMSVAIVFLSNYGAEIGLGLGGIVIVYTGYNFTTRNNLVTLREDAQKKGFKAFEVAMQEIKEYKTVHDFSNLDVAMQRMESSLYDSTEAEAKASALIPKVGTVQAMISGVGYTGLCLLAGRRVLSQQLGASDYAFIGSLAVQFLTPLNGLANAMNQITSSIPDVEVIFDDFEKIPKAKDTSSNPLIVNSANASIELTSVNFHYKQEHNQIITVLKNISHKIEPGKKIGIVGTSGGGKSTLLHLLMRYYDLTSGKILINDQDINQISLKSLRSAIGIVPQMPVLFNDTLYNNIAYGGLSRAGGVSKEDVEAAVDSACLRSFVNGLPDGLNTIVGEGGAKISGGQRQRIAIARVILKNPSIVILDEATSALDSETEKEIQANLDTVFRGKTQLVVAHRLETIQNSDSILVFDLGNIVESGTHEQLLEKNGVYTNLYKPKTELSSFYSNANTPRGYSPTVFKPTPSTISVTSVSSNQTIDCQDNAIELKAITFHS
jgi:ABC-type multidrug transport system fused ATPase/permease subunit